MAGKTREILFKHARKRAAERYDLELDWQLFEQLNGVIIQHSRNTLKSARLLFLAKESLTLSHWLIDGMYIIIFDMKRKAIRTFLPADAIHNYLSGSTYMENRRAWNR